MSTHADFTFDGATAPSLVSRRDDIRAHSQSATEAYQTETVSGREAVVSLQDEWNRLSDVSVGTAVFQAFDLCLAWLDAYAFCDAPTHRARVVTFYDSDGALVALAPLADNLSGLAPMAEWIGDPLVQYGDILMDPAVDLAALGDAFSAVIAGWPISGLHLRNVREDARIRQVLSLDGADVGEHREAALAEFSDFEDAEAYFATFSKRSKKNRKTKRRKLAEQGELSFDVVKPGDEGAAYCALALKWKIAWLAERGLSSRAFMDDRALKALQAACGRDHPANPIRLYVQKVDGAPVAIEIGLVGPAGNAAFMGTYDPAYENLSAGKVQMESSVLYGFEEGWAGYDMLAPLSDYKQSWATRTIGVCDFMIPTSLKGRLYRDGYLRVARPALKKAWNAIPVSLRSLALRRGNGIAAL